MTIQKRMDASVDKFEKVVCDAKNVHIQRRIKRLTREQAGNNAKYAGKFW